MLPNRSRWLAAALAVVAFTWWDAAAQDLRLPNTAGSVKFAVIGDNGTGDREQFDIADQMVKYHAKFAFDRVIMLGDNVYGGQGATDLQNKFAQPYKALLDGGVKFYASLGNHDSPNNVRYPLWNMGGQPYYSTTVKNVQFLALDSNKVDQKELDWIETTLKNSHEEWKICYFHHPLYSDGGTHGSSVELRVLLEPIFVANGVSVVFSGHDHIYERITPQKGITYFVSGSAGQLRRGDTRRSAMTAAYFDQDCSFMLVEVAGSELTYQAVSRLGRIVDAGSIHLPVRPAGKQLQEHRP